MDMQHCLLSIFVTFYTQDDDEASDDDDDGDDDDDDDDDIIPLGWSEINRANQRGLGLGSDSRGY
eukprot:2854534-Amphidinium_carterae.1